MKGIYDGDTVSTEKILRNGKVAVGMKQEFNTQTPKAFTFLGVSLGASGGGGKAFGTLPADSTVYSASLGKEIRGLERQLIAAVTKIISHINTLNNQRRKFKNNLADKEKFEAYQAYNDVHTQGFAIAIKSAEDMITILTKRLNETENLAGLKKLVDHAKDKLTTAINDVKTAAQAAATSTFKLQNQTTSLTASGVEKTDLIDTDNINIALEVYKRMLFDWHNHEVLGAGTKDHIDVMTSSNEALKIKKDADNNMSWYSMCKTILDENLPIKFPNTPKGKAAFWSFMIFFIAEKVGLEQFTDPNAASAGDDFIKEKLQEKNPTGLKTRKVTPADVLVKMEIHAGKRTQTATAPADTTKKSQLIFTNIEPAAIAATKKELNNVERTISTARNLVNAVKTQGKSVEKNDGMYLTTYKTKLRENLKTLHDMYMALPENKTLKDLVDKMDHISQAAVLITTHTEKLAAAGHINPEALHEYLTASPDNTAIDHPAVQRIAAHLKDDEARPRFLASIGAH